MKGIVGQLSRLNRAGLEESHVRRKAFLAVVKSLRKHFFLTLSSHWHETRADKGKTALKELFETLGTQTRFVFVNVAGAVVPNVELQFVLPKIDQTEDGGYSLGTAQNAKLVITPGSEPDECILTMLDMNGRESVETASSEELQGICIELVEGQITWERMSLV